MEGGGRVGNNNDNKDKQHKDPRAFTQEVVNETEGAYPVPPEEESCVGNGLDGYGMEAWDDVDGTALDPCKVKLARAEEIAHYKKMNTFKLVPLKECTDCTGRPPIQVKWVDHNKGDSLRPVYISRLVAEQFNEGRDDTLYAPTPPLESLRMILSNAVPGEESKCILSVDVSRAYMYAPASERIFVEYAMKPRAMEQMVAVGSCLPQCMGLVPRH